MSHRVCPVWMGYLLLCPLRRMGQDPERVLGSWVEPGMTVLEVGPGMGFFTLPLARRVGGGGRVVCVDVREEMLAAVRRRAERGGVGGRIETRACPEDSLGIGDLAGAVDFVLLFAVVHEVPDASHLFAEIARAMKPGGRCLVAEPSFHVSAGEFEQTLAAAAGHGLQRLEQPRIRASRTALLGRV